MNDRLQDLYGSAMEAIDLEEIIEADEYFQQMLEIAPNDPLTLEVAGDLAKEMGEHDKAEAYYAQMDRFSDRPDVRGRAQMSLGFLCRDKEESDTACDHFRQAIEWFYTIGEVEDCLTCLGAMGEVQFNCGQFRDSVESFRSLLREAEEAEVEGAELYVIDAMRQQADGLRFLGELAEAEDLYRRVIARGDDDDLYFQLANALDGLGVVLQVQGRYEEAEKLHREALRINEKNGDQEGASVNFGNLARLNIHRKNWDQAEHFIRDSLAIDVEEENINGIGFGQLLLAEIECGRGNYEAADKILHKARRLYERHGITDDMASLISKLGYLRRLQGRLDEAETLQMEAKQMAEEMEHTDGIAETLNELAEIRKSQGRIDEARDLWQQSLAVFESLHSLRMIQEVKDSLAKLDL